MLINKKQLAAFRNKAFAQFEEDLLDHISDFSPFHSKAVGEDGLRETIRLGLINAENYGFTLHGSVRFYIEMMIMFGSHYDTDPQYPWAGVVLSDESYGSQLDKADQLHNLYLDYAEKVIGKNSEFPLQALIQVGSTDSETVEMDDDNMLEHMKKIYPQKVEYLGEDLVRGIINRGKGKAVSYNIDSKEGILLLIGLTFAVGHKFDDDPMYPWMNRTLNDPESKMEPNQRAERLYRKVQVYLMKTLQNLT
jgi:hypothetical protein